MPAYLGRQTDDLCPSASCRSLNLPQCARYHAIHPSTDHLPLIVQQDTRGIIESATHQRRSAVDDQHSRDISPIWPPLPLLRPYHDCPTNIPSSDFLDVRARSWHLGVGLRHGSGFVDDAYDLVTCRLSSSVPSHVVKHSPTVANPAECFRVFTLRMLMHSAIKPPELSMICRQPSPGRGYRSTRSRSP